MTPRKILICGLPGSGKTTLARELAPLIGAVHWDGDEVRALTHNHDFSEQGRIIQAAAMLRLCDKATASGKHAIASFICPTHDLRLLFDADYTIFMDTIFNGRYEDTIMIWRRPVNPDYVIQKHDIHHASVIAERLSQPLLKWNELAPTAVMIGRFQPWHKGHRALFEKALEKYGQVVIYVRNMPQDENNPADFQMVQASILMDLINFSGRYQVRSAPNVAAVVYGRDVGYAIDEIRLDKVTEAVSGTNIRLGRMKSGL